jgi:hypothetical protein
MKKLFLLITLISTMAAYAGSYLYACPKASCGYSTIKSTPGSITPCPGCKQGALFGKEIVTKN